MAKIGRNDPCPCGSGRKYKKCCLEADEAATRRERAEEAARVVPNRVEANNFHPFGGTGLPPDPWEALRGYRPDSVPPELRSVLCQIQGLADCAAKRAEIESAQVRLEAHRDEYERLIQEPNEFITRAEALFDEPPFEDMRFRVPALDQAFESIGYPPLSRGAELITFARRVTDFLVDDAQRTVLARRLACLMPDYVEEERYLDAWIIQHSFTLLCDPPEDGCSPFLLFMFMYPLRQWQQARDQDEQELFGQLGFDRETILQQGHKGIAALLDSAEMGHGGLETVARFLDSHPQLAAYMHDRCHEAEQAAVELLRRDEGRSLLLDSAEMAPWLARLSERLAMHPVLIEAAKTGKEPTKRARKTFARVVADFADEMVTEVFTSERLQRLRDEIDVLRRRFEQDGIDESLALSGMYMAASNSPPPAENYVLGKLCLASMEDAWQEL